MGTPFTLVGHPSIRATRRLVVQGRGRLDTSPGHFAPHTGLNQGRRRRSLQEHSSGHGSASDLRGPGSDPTLVAGRRSGLVRLAARSLAVQMSTTSSLRRMAILVALLPQLLLMGLGQGVVLCVAPGGHVQMEAVASLCCADSTSGEAARDVSLSTPIGDSDCDQCTDYRISLDSIMAPDSRTEAFERLPGCLAATPTEAPRLLPGSTSSPYFGRAPDRGHAPPYLGHLRSVLLRC